MVKTFRTNILTPVFLQIKRLVKYLFGVHGFAIRSDSRMMKK